MNQETVLVTTVSVECYKCGVLWWVSSELHRQWKDHGVEFYCPNGHGQIYTTPTVTKLQRELDATKSKLATAQFELLAAEKKTRQLQLRAKNGMCPCCHREFVNMARHMKTKHPNFAA